ncbi:major pollen allergen Ole e 10 [Rosa sericea]
MGVSSLRHSALFFLFLFFSSGSSVPKNPPLEAIQQSKRQVIHENHILFSSAVSTTQLESIPLVNPSPTVTTPTLVFPASPPPPTTMTTPTTPTTIPPTPPIPPTPTTTPTTPTTTPTTPSTTPTTPFTTPASSGGSGSWCIASQSASETALQVALDYACGYGGADCSPIQPSGSCYNPNTLRDHASYAFNNYYQKNPAPTSCSFGGTAQLTTTDPSSGSCRYPSSTASTSSSTPPYQTPPSTPTSMTTPPSPTTPLIDTPGGSTIYGSPSESPNAANSISSCKLLLSTTLLGSLLAAIYL